MTPENFLLDRDGNIKYVNYEIDYNKIENNDNCQIFDYDKPNEFNLIHDDWYNLGVLMYEMLMNIPPFYISQVPYNIFDIFEERVVKRHSLLKVE